jgi:hypothetical protein
LTFPRVNLLALADRLFVNDAPRFAKGPDQQVIEDVGLQLIAGWATAIDPGADNERTQSLSFLVTNDNTQLFTQQPAVASDGTLTFAPAPNAFGSATVTVTARDNGGTANGGADTSLSQAFTITVGAVNDAPAFVKGADQIVNEDAGSQSVAAWATSIVAGPPNENGQRLQFVLTNSNPGLFCAAPQIDSKGTLRYTPAANANGTAVITVCLKDDGGTENGGLDTSEEESFTITVKPVNDGPSGSNNTIVADRNRSYTFKPLDFGFDDGNDTPANRLKAVKIVELPQWGTLRLNGAAVAAQQVIDARELRTLTYTPKNAGLPARPVTFKFLVQDNGGTTDGGMDWSAKANTITLKIVPNSRREYLEWMADFDEERDSVGKPLEKIAVSSSSWVATFVKSGADTVEEDWSVRF